MVDRIKTMGRRKEEEDDDYSGRKHKKHSSRKHDEERKSSKDRRLDRERTSSRKRSHKESDGNKYDRDYEKGSSSRKKKKHRRYDDDDSDGSGDRKKKHKHDRRTKKHSSKKSGDHSRKERKRDKKNNDDKEQKPKAAIKINKNNLYPLGNIRKTPPEKLLDAEKDYFEYHTHLFVYLYREEGVMFGDLSADQSRAAFKRFCKRYNDSDLEMEYYNPKGLPSHAIEECKTTSHKWSFNASDTELKSLQFLQEGIRKQTEYYNEEQKEGNDKTRKIAPNSNEIRNRKSNISSRNERSEPQQHQRKRKTPQEQLEERKANRRLREDIRNVEDELSGGRKEGRERQIEKRKEKAMSIHGSAKDREDVRMGGIELNDSEIYGGGSGAADDFESALARERHRKERRAEKQTARLNELQQKEQDRQDSMLKMLGISGIKAGEKIKIAPRKD